MLKEEQETLAQDQPQMKDCVGCHREEIEEVPPTRPSTQNFPKTEAKLGHRKSPSHTQPNAECGEREPICDIRMQGQLKARGKQEH